MVIRIRRGYEEDFEEWDNFLMRSQMQNVLQSGVMAKVWEYISFKPFLIVAEEKNDIVGGLMSHIWFGNSKLYPLYRPFSIFRTQYGPIISSNSTGNRLFLLQKILEFTQKEVKTQKLMQHIVSTNYKWGDRVFRDAGYKLMPLGLRHTFIVNLQVPKESLWKSLDSDKRRCINRARKYEVEVIEGVKEETPKLFYHLYVNTARRLGILPDPYLFIEGIWKILVPKGYAKFLFAYYNKKPVGTLLFLIFNNRLYHYMSASEKEYWRVNPNHLLIWRSLEYGLEKGYKSCNFMGAPGPEEKNHPEYGLYMFKRGWGGQMTDIRFFSKVFSPKAQYIWKLATVAMNRLPKLLMLLER